MRTSDTVRGICVTSANTLVVIKRERPVQDPYWVFPGGAVEDTDSSLESALRRELWEELGASVDIGRCLVTWSTLGENGVESRQFFYFCRLLSWSQEGGCGAEWAPERRAGYALEEVPLDESVLAQINLLPKKVQQYLLANCSNIENASPIAMK